MKSIAETQVHVMCQQGVRRQGRDGVCRFEYVTDRLKFLSRLNHCPVCSGSKARELTEDTDGQ